MSKHRSDQEIKNIIFDFGGVIINISHGKVESAFRNLGVSHFQDMFNQAVQSELFRKFEKGLVTPAGFRSALRQLTGLKVTDTMLDDAWNQIIGDYPPERITLLGEIKQNYRLFLLSNTNSIHYDYYIGKFSNEFGFEFRELFEGTFWSFQRGKRKPDAEAFLDVVETHNLDPVRTLFVDDSNQNIMAAQQTGLKALHLMDGLEITELFRHGFLKPDFHLYKHPE
jgi:putative hydrolase of the HAD superfamily